ncbi:MAG TPA: ribosome maturation factor RimM [Ignavibacteriaceae bacterium]|nr:ribosome maturation factor RimM [Ignavibacteriaceae bacterium]
MDEFFLIARVSSVSGTEGFVKILSYSDVPERFLSLHEVYIDFFDSKKKLLVEKVKQVKSNFYIKFTNFNSDKEVKPLLGKEIFVDEKNVIRLPENSYFIHDLLGSTVVRNNKYFGRIVDVLPYPANDVYVIENEDGEEILLPALSELIENFDAKKKMMVLKPGESFYEDEN